MAATPDANLVGFVAALATALLGVGVVWVAEHMLGSRWGARLAEALATGLLTVAALVVGLQLGGDPGALDRFLLPVALGVLLAGFGAAADLGAPRPFTGLEARILRSATLLGVALWAAATHGIRIEALKLPFTTTSVPLGQLGNLVTAVWVWLFAVLFGRAATIPGVAAGVSCAAAVTFHLICRMRPDLTGPHGALFSAILAGACLPQALFARFLERAGGTAGGYVIGFYVGLASVAGALKNTALLIAAVPLIVAGVPLFAAVCTYAADLRSGWRAVAVARRRQHLHEILLQQGYSPAQVLQWVMAGTVYLCAVAILLVAIIRVTFVLKLLLIAVALAAGLVVFYVMLRMMPRPGLLQAAGRPETVNLLGVKLNPVTMPQALAEAERYIREDRPHMIVTTDASMLMRAHDDPNFRAIVNTADLVTPDGAGVVLAGRLLNIPIEARCAGCDMVSGLCEVAARLGRSVYLLGAAPGVAEKAAENLQRQIPGLQVAGCHDGYFTPEQEPQIVAQIKQARPAVLFVALGIPRQEEWIRAHLEELGVPVCVGVGGSFDVISGLKKRAPVWMQRAGLEWLYRVVREPWRLPRLAALPRIVILAFAELLRPPARME